MVNPYDWQRLVPRMTAEVARPSGPLQSGDAIVSWLLSQASNLADTRAVIGGLAQRLVAAGFPLYRLFQSVRALHPQVVAIGCQWPRRSQPAAKRSANVPIATLDPHVRAQT